MQFQVHPRLLKSEPMQRCKLGICQAACCLYGVWVDLDEVCQITEHASLIAPHLPADNREAQTWFEDSVEPDEFTPSHSVRHTRVLADPGHYGGTRCVFLRPDHKCALQVASTSLNHHPWKWKPFYCVLHPLDLDDNGLITLDETHLLVEERGSCLVPASQPIPLIETFEPELRYLLGDTAYEDLLGKNHS